MKEIKITFIVVILLMYFMIVAVGDQPDWVLANPPLFKKRKLPRMTYNKALSRFFFFFNNDCNEE